MSYLMEHPDEAVRLEKKTRVDQVVRQATWAGIRPGMNVLDVGCGVGKTTAILKQVVGDKGRCTGLDQSPDRLEKAREAFGAEGIRFVQHDIRKPYQAEVPFDAVWIRFLLEYFGDDPLKIVKNAVASLRPGGVLVLGDLDHNCLNHHGHSERLETALCNAVKHLQEHRHFDPYAGRKLYAHMVDLGFQDIDVAMEAHHLFFGELDPVDAENWLSKFTVAVRQSGYPFEEYGGDIEAAFNDFRAHLFNPRRFIYTPLILVRGTKPPE
ncbi:MAG: methyltransferase domain-containing protein [Geothermobacteraceae bacterium]